MEKDCDLTQVQAAFLYTVRMIYCLRNKSELLYRDTQYHPKKKLQRQLNELIYYSMLSRIDALTTASCS